MAMASEPFEATDDNGITVTGTVDVYRHPKGPYFDPKSKFYKNPRYADAQFDYFNTREACTIDRNVLAEAMREAFRKALEKFQISKPDPDKVRDDVENSISATRQQCIQNADKYVSNETSSSTNWETGKAVGKLSARAYAAVPAPGGGIQTIVARENSWPVDDVSAPKDDASSNADSRDTERGAAATGIGNPSPADPGDTRSPVLRALLRYRATAAPDGPAPTSVQGARLLAPYYPGQQSSFGGRSGNSPGVPSPDVPLRRVSSAFPGMTPPNPDQPAALPRPGLPLGIFSGDPMPSSTAPPPLGGLLYNSSVPGNNDLPNFLAGLVSRNSTSPEPPQQTAGGKPERRLGRSILNQSPAPAYDPLDTAVASLVPSDGANYSGGVLGRFAGKEGIDQQSPNQPAPQDDKQEQADLQALEDRFASSGSIADAWTLYKARVASQR